MLDLRKELQSWDGQSTLNLAKVYQASVFESEFVDQALDLLKDDQVQVAAAWLIKQHCENGGIFTLVDISAIYDHVSGLQKWQAQLNILQAMDYLPIPPSHKQQVENFLRTCLASDNKFVRAWAYNGFAILAKCYPNYRSEADRFIDMAIRDEVPLVKAKIRQIQAK